MLGQILSSPLDTQYWNRAASLCPLCFPNSLHLCTEQFLKLKLNTIYIRQARTHMHTGVCPERQYVSCTQRAPGNAYYLLSKKGRACALGPHTALLPTFALLAARGREAGTGEGSANLTVTVGAEAIVGIPEVIKEKPRLQDPEGQN